MPKGTKHCCEEHVDIAFDDFLLETETFPYMDKSSNHQCSYCMKPAKYTLTTEDSNKE